MGVDWFNCENCDQCFSDCSGWTLCECGERFCKWCKVDLINKFGRSIPANDCDSSDCDFSDWEYDIKKCFICMKKKEDKIKELKKEKYTIYKNKLDKIKLPMLNNLNNAIKRTNNKYYKILMSSN